MRPLLLFSFLLTLIGAQSFFLPAEAAPSPPFGGSSASSEQKDADSTDSPRFMMRQFLDMMEREDYDAALKYVELPKGLSLQEKRDWVSLLFDVLNRRGDIDIGMLSNNAMGKTTDSPYADLEIIGYVRIAGGSIPIELRLVTEKNNRKVWKFSEDFMGKMPEVAMDLRRSAVENLVPEALKTKQFLGFKVWQMIGVIVAAVVAYLCSVILAWIFSACLRLATKQFKWPIPETAFHRFETPLRLFAGIMAFTILLVLLGIDLRYRLRLAYVETIGMTLAFVLFAIRLNAAVFEMNRFSKRARHGKISTSAMSLPIQRTINVLLVILGILFLMKNLGLDVTTIIAGLGIGGFAVALASQKTIENLFGGISVIMDQPVRVGDFGKFGAIMGTVEDIGLRSTKVRTLDRTIVTIPNAEFSHMTIENYERRDKIRWNTVLTLRPETSADQMRLVLMKIKELLLAHTMVYKEPARVRFVGFAPNGLNIDIFAYVRTSDYSDYLAVLEDLNLRVMDILQEAGSGIALPAQVNYNFPGDWQANQDPRLVASSFDRVRQEGGFPQPHYPPDWSEPRIDTLNFPEKPI